MTDMANPDEELGWLLQKLVNRISHRGQGKSFAIMSEASVTVPQVILMHRMIHEGLRNPSELARSLGMSGPAVSQMLDRLFQLGLIERTECREDRRQRLVTVTPKGKALCKRVQRARSTEYAEGVAKLSKPLQSELKRALAHALDELELAEKAELPEFADQ